jgi:photosystem II stability/assembly factor-like uncharacterized protein
MVGKILGFSAQLAPWIVVGSLGYAAAFIKPKVEPMPLPQPLVEPRDVFYDVDTDIGESYWFVGNAGTVLQSGEGKEEWKRHELPEPINLQGVAVSSKGDVVAAGNQGAVFVLRKGSSDWSSHRLPVSDRAGKMVEVAWIDDAFWVIGEMGAIFKSDAAAESWKQLGIDEDVSLNDIARSPDGGLWIAAEFGLVLYSDDAGETWSQSELGRESLRALAFDPSGNGVIVGNNGSVMHSSDSGESWNSVDSATEEHLYDVGYTGEFWLAVGNSGAILKSPNGKTWERLRLEGFGSGYHTRLLATANRTVIAGETIGELTGSTWLSWPVEEN